MDDVVRARREVPRTCFGVEHVVRRGDERGERPCPPLVVAHGPERSHLRHGWASLPAGSGLDSAGVAVISELAEDGVVEGTYAVARKRRLRTRSGSDYLALELVDPSGRIEGRIWHDVDLLDSRFAEGDAVRVLGRVERYRNQLQLDVRAIEPAGGCRSDRADAGAPPRRRRAGRLPRLPRQRDRTRRLAEASQDNPRRPRPTAQLSGAARLTRGASRVRRRPARAHGRCRHDLPGARAAPSPAALRPAARRRAPS